MAAEQQMKVGMGRWRWMPQK